MSEIVFGFCSNESAVISECLSQGRGWHVWQRCVSAGVLSTPQQAATAWREPGTASPSQSSSDSNTQPAHTHRPSFSEIKNTRGVWPGRSFLPTHHLPLQSHTLRAAVVIQLAWLWVAVGSSLHVSSTHGLLGQFESKKL